MRSRRHEQRSTTTPRWWRGPGLLATLLLAACAGAPRPQPPSPQVDRTVSWLHEDNEGALRLARFGTLHETVRILLIASGQQADWVRYGAVTLSVGSCQRALARHDEGMRECNLVAVDATTAVLILSESSTCERWTCLEHSWAFLSDYPGALQLPPRRAADYGSLRADLSRDVAEALWVAGYRGRSDPRMVDASDPYAEDPLVYEQELARFSIASYRSCRRAQGSEELVCRSGEGGVIGVDPASSERRVIASLEQALQSGAVVDPAGGEERVWWTPEGELALRVKMQRHPLCGAGPCTLLGLVPWPVREAQAPRFVRLD